MTGSFLDWSVVTHSCGPLQHPSQQDKAIARMKFASAIVLSLSAGLAAAADWGFQDATISISSKGAGVAGGFKEKYVIPLRLVLDQETTSTDTLLGYPPERHWERK